MGVPAFSWLRVLYIVLFAIVESYLIAQRIAGQSGRPLWQVWAVSLMFIAVLAVFMLLSRVLMVLLSLAGVGLLLTSSLGWPLWETGALLWFLGGLVSCLITLSISARYIAPPFNQELSTSSYLSLILLLRHAFRDLLRPKPFPNSAAGLPNSFNTIGAGFIPSHQVITVRQGIRYVNALGPGYSLISSRQFISDLIDIRPQSRRRTLRVTTRDGITVETIISVRFHLRRPVQRNERVPFHFSKDAVREHVHAETILEREQIERAYERVCPRAHLFATEAISQRTLDEVAPVNASSELISRTIADHVKEKLEEEFHSKGLEIDSVSLGMFNLPETLQKEREKQWQKGWQDPIKNRRMGTSMKALDADSAAMQLEVLEELARNVETLRGASNLPLNQAVADRLQQILTEAATEGVLRTLIPAPSAPKEDKKEDKDKKA